MSETDAPSPDELDLFVPPEIPNIGVRVDPTHLLRKEAAYLRLNPKQREQVDQNTAIANAEGHDTKADIDTLVDAGSLLPIGENQYSDKTGQRHFHHDPNTGRLRMIKDEEGTRYDHPEDRTEAGV